MPRVSAATFDAASTSGTRVMTLGALGAGEARPAPGGPAQSYGPPYAQPVWTYNMEPPYISSPDFPQNLLRPTNKGCTTCKAASSGRPITSLLAGLGSPALAGLGAGDPATDASKGDQVYCTTQAGAMYIGSMRLAYSALGAAFGGIHGYRRNGGKMGWAVAWGAAGAFLPLLTGIVAVAQGYGKRA